MLTGKKIGRKKPFLHIDSCGCIAQGEYYKDNQLLKGVTTAVDREIT